MAPDDDLLDLKAAWDAATPRPDPAARAANLRLAQENFRRLQAAPEPEPAPGRFRAWFGTLTGRGAITAATAVLAVGFLGFTPQGREVWRMAPTDGGAPAPSSKVPAEEAYGDAVAATEAAPAEDVVEQTAPEPAPAPVAPGPEAAPAAEPGPEAMAAPAEEAARSAPADAPMGAPAPEAATGLADSEAPTALAAPETRMAAPMASGGAAFVAPSAEAEGDAARTMAEAAPPPPEGAAELAQAAGDRRAEPELAGSLEQVRAAVLAGRRPAPEEVRIGEMAAAAMPVPPPLGPGDGGVVPGVLVERAPWAPGASLVVVTAGAPGPGVEGVSAEVAWAPGVEARRLGGGDPQVWLVTPGADLSGDWGSVQILWTEDGVARAVEVPVTGSEPGAPLAAAVAGWGLLLRGEIDPAAWGYAEAAALAKSARSPEATDLSRLILRSGTLSP